MGSTGPTAPSPRRSKREGNAAPGLPKYLLGSVGGPWSPFSNPPSPGGGSKGRLSVFHILDAYCKSLVSHITEENCLATCWSHYLVAAYSLPIWKCRPRLLHIQSQCQRPCATQEENRLQHFEIVGGKISGICIEEISLWPLEPLSATPPPQTCGGSKPPPPSPLKFSPAQPSPSQRKSAIRAAYQFVSMLTPPPHHHHEHERGSSTTIQLPAPPSCPPPPSQGRTAENGHPSHYPFLSPQPRSEGTPSHNTAKRVKPEARIGRPTPSFWFTQRHSTVRRREQERKPRGATVVHCAGMAECLASHSSRYLGHPKPFLLNRSPPLPPPPAGLSVTLLALSQGYRHWGAGDLMPNNTTWTVEGQTKALSAPMAVYMVPSPSGPVPRSPSPTVVWRQHTQLKVERCFGRSFGGGRGGAGDQPVTALTPASLLLQNCRCDTDPDSGWACAFEWDWQKAQRAPNGVRCALCCGGGNRAVLHQWPFFSDQIGGVQG